MKRVIDSGSITHNLVSLGVLYKLQRLSAYYDSDRDRCHSLISPRQLTCKAQYLSYNLIITLHDQLYFKIHCR